MGKINDQGVETAEVENVNPPAEIPGSASCCG